MHKLARGLRVAVTLASSCRARRPLQTARSVCAVALSESPERRLHPTSCSALCRRKYSVILGAGNLTNEVYHAVANSFLNGLEEAVDSLDEQGIKVDMDSAEGVVTIKFPGHTFVVNKQAPSQQLWLSSPISGPWHYLYNEATGEWLCTRDQHSLVELLSKEISELTGTDFNVES